MTVVAPLSVDQVEREVGRGMTDVCGVVRGDATDINLGCGSRCSWANFVSDGVEEAQRNAVAGQFGDKRLGPRVHGMTLDDRPRNRWPGRAGVRKDTAGRQVNEALVGGVDLLFPEVRP